MTYEDALLELVRSARETGARLGVVTAINTTDASLTIDISTATPLTGIRWLAPYVPVVGDFVTILRVGTSWQVLGKLSKDLTRGPTLIQGTATVLPYAVYAGVKNTGAATWTWTAAGPASYQGKEPWSNPKAHRTLYLYPALADQLPVGATVTSMKLRMTKWADDNVAENLHSPRIHAHSNTSAPLGEPSWVAGFGPMAGVGALGNGESAQTDVPAAWLAAWLAGTIRGFGLNTDAIADYSLWDRGSGAVTITYTAPI